ncbi:MAG: hypothetical protein IKH14_08715, partial [Prevotella sp.]|nr:hypothetical protein [Prevotella sp.]
GKTNNVRRMFFLICFFLFSDFKDFEVFKVLRVFYDFAKVVVFFRFAKEKRLFVGFLIGCLRKVMSKREGLSRFFVKNIWREWK